MGRILVSVLLALSLTISPSYAKDHSFDPVALVARVKLSLVMVEYPDYEQNQTHVCAGFVIDAARGWALTAKHCVPPDDSTDIVVDESIYSYVVAQDEAFAIVSVPAMYKPPLELRKDDTEFGEPAVAIGYGYGQFMVLPRYVAAKQDGDFALSDQLAQGMSGGPVVDRDAKVIGISQASTLDGVIGIACGTGEIRAFLDRAMKKAR